MYEPKPKTIVPKLFGVLWEIKSVYGVPKDYRSRSSNYWMHLKGWYEYRSKNHYRNDHKHHQHPNHRDARNKEMDNISRCYGCDRLILLSKISTRGRIFSEKWNIIWKETQVTPNKSCSNSVINRIRKTQWRRYRSTGNPEPVPLSFESEYPQQFYYTMNQHIGPDNPESEYNYKDNQCAEWEPQDF